MKRLDPEVKNLRRLCRTLARTISELVIIIESYQADELKRLKKEMK